MRIVFFSLCALSSLLVSHDLSAQEPRNRTLAEELPVIPSGIRPSVYPLPRTDWATTVQNIFAEAKNAGPTTELILDGDSITAGWRRFWKDHFPKAKIYNFAISGDRTQHLLWRLQQGQLNSMHPKMVLLMIGTNNLGNKESPEDTIAGVQAVVEEYRKLCSDADIYVLGLLPRGPKQELRAQIQTVNEAIAKLEDGKHVFYLDCSDVFLKDDGQIDPALMPDYLHPSEKGYAAWAKVLKPLIEKLP